MAFGEEWLMEDCISIDALFDESGTAPNLSADPRLLLNAADVVFGVDRMSGRQFLVYDADALRHVIQTGKSSRFLVVRIELDQETDDLERLLALMIVVRGKHDYQTAEDDIRIGSSSPGTSQ
jgi:hypothetical protein